ncbi:hypothetical protein ABE073_03945 [Lederbergia citrisecunda]|uniref:hypothetical protein n=1 Tax=Lederbergia citrisecunda TaxID=2833583 RepID=UPI003D2C5059
MSKYSAFRNRVKAGGETHLDGFRNATKRQIRAYIQNSPTRSEVELLQLEEQSDKTYTLIPAETKIAIVSDKETFYKRTILFLPDEDVQMGSYVKYDNKTYLVTNISDVNGYPQSFVEYCNQSIKVKGEKTEILTGEKDIYGKPKKITVQPEFYIPCVSTSKIYSVLDNSQMPLPEGAIMIYLPYHKEIDIPVNYEFQIHGDNYQVTTVNKINVLTDENGFVYGYLEIRGQRRQNVK